MQPPPPPDGPVNAWQYDEIVFSDPTKAFFDILMKHPPTPLPRVRRRAAPPHVAYQASLVPAANASKTQMPEFTQQMEKEEAERLDQAKKNIVAETDRLRGILIEREKEQERLKKEVEALEKA